MTVMKGFCTCVRDYTGTAFDSYDIMAVNPSCPVHGRGSSTVNDLLSVKALYGATVKAK